MKCTSSECWQKAKHHCCYCCSLFVDRVVCVFVIPFPRQQKLIRGSVVFFLPLGCYGFLLILIILIVKKRKKSKPCMNPSHKLQHSDVVQPQRVSNTFLPFFFFFFVNCRHHWDQGEGVFSAETKTLIKLEFPWQLFSFLSRSGKMKGAACCRH